MNKAIKVTFITMILLLNNIFFVVESHASSLKYAVPLNDNVIVYESTLEGAAPVAVLRINEPLIIHSEEDDWWVVKFGNGYGYIHKSDVSSSTTWYTQNVNTSYRNSKTLIKTNVDTEVYDNTSGKLVEMGKIKAGIEYPIIIEEFTNFWKVDFGGRIGYIEKNKVSVEEVKTTPIKSENPNTIAYAVPLKDNVTVYDDSTGEFKPIVIMRLNQPLIIDSEMENWWIVKLGNGYGYIQKEDVQRSIIWTTENVNKTSKNSNTSIITNVDAQVFDNTSGKLVEMGKIKAGYRYPVIREYGNYWEIDFGGRIGYVAKVRASLDKGIPVLMYHHILTPEEKANSTYANASTTVTTEEFNAQMEWLYKNGYATISTSDLERYLKHKINLSSKAVVITFDDGILSTREYAYPTLKKYGFVADQFIITGRTLGYSVQFNWRNLQYLSLQDMENLEDVFNYGSHTHNLHDVVNNKALALIKSENEVLNDINTSMDMLHTTHFAYPFGQYNENVVNILQNLGMTMAYTTKTGKVNLGDNLLQLNRIGIEPGVSIQNFASKVNN